MENLEIDPGFIVGDDQIAFIDLLELDFFLCYSDRGLAIEN